MRILIVLVNFFGTTIRAENLRVCNAKENSRNASKRKNTSSKYKGVIFHKRDNVWLASIRYNRKAFHLGTFRSEIEAAKKYNETALRYFKEFAKLNLIEEEL